MAKAQNRIQLILHELKHHLPFTLLGVLLSMGLLFGLHAFLEFSEEHHVFEQLFHSFHFAHLFLSAVTSAAILFRHEHQKTKALIVGTVSSILFCSLSDILLPFLGGKLLQTPMEFHWDLLEQPWTILAFSLGGSILGLFAEIRFKKISYWTHGSHVFVSSLASLFYLVSFGFENWLSGFVGIFAITSIAVIIPCCSSDILFPLSWVGGLHGHEHEDEHTNPGK